MSQIVRVESREARTPLATETVASEMLEGATTMTATAMVL